MKKSNIVSVDLKAFFGSLLEQWKTVVIFAVAGAVLMPCAMSKKINDSAKDEADTYKELSMMSDEEKLHTLPELDCVRVSLALEQKELIEAQEKYYANSIVDPMLANGELPVLEFHWVISDSDNVQAVDSAYCAALTDPETVSIVREALDQSYSQTEDIYIRELITAKDKDGIKLSVVIPEGTDINVLKSGINGRIDAVSQDISNEIGKHRISLVSVEETTIIDEEKIAVKTENDIKYKDLKEYYTSLVLEFDYNETVVFNSITIEDDSRNTYVDPGIDFSPKMIAAGFAVAIIAYIIFYLIYVVLSSCVHDASVITDTLGINLLGSVSKYSHKGIGALVFSKMVYGLLRKKTIEGKSLDRVADAVVSLCKHDSYSKVLFVTPGMKKDYSEETKKLTGRVNKASGIEVKSADNISDSKALEGFDAVILGVCSGSTKYAELMDVAVLCEHCGKTIIGGVYFD